MKPDTRNSLTVAIVGLLAILAFWFFLVRPVGAEQQPAGTNLICSKASGCDITVYHPDGTSEVKTLRRGDQIERSGVHGTPAACDGWIDEETGEEYGCYDLRGGASLGETARSARTVRGSLTPSAAPLPPFVTMVGLPGEGR